MTNDSTEATGQGQATSDPTESPQESTQAPQGGDDTSVPESIDDTDDTGQASKARKQAARYRQRARDAEGENEKLTAQVDALQRQMAEDYLSTLLDRPASFWLAGHSPAEFLTDEGTLDRAALHTAALEAAAEHGLAVASTPVFTSAGAHRSETPSSATSWAEALKR